MSESPICDVCGDDCRIVLWREGTRRELARKRSRLPSAHLRARHVLSAAACPLPRCKYKYPARPQIISHFVGAAVDKSLPHAPLVAAEKRSADPHLACGLLHVVELVAVLAVRRVGPSRVDGAFGKKRLEDLLREALPMLDGLPDHPRARGVTSSRSGMVKASTLHSTCHALSRRSAVASNPAFPPTSRANSSTSASATGMPASIIASIVQVFAPTAKSPRLRSLVRGSFRRPPAG